MPVAETLEERGRDATVPVTVRVKLTDGWGGERWDVCGAVDERTSLSIGDIGIYEFDAYSDFPETILSAVCHTLAECSAFQAGVFYSVKVSIRDGGTTIGSASRYFRNSCSWMED